MLAGEDLVGGLLDDLRRLDHVLLPVGGADGHTDGGRREELLRMYILRTRQEDTCKKKKKKKKRRGPVVVNVWCVVG